MNLNDSQRRAVERTGQDVCVEAGPGSGKTRVLVERFRWLVDQGVDPDRILAFTFTEKAAAEIKTRLAKSFEDTPELRTVVERSWVSTVHGFCARLLRENPIDAGIDPEFTVIDELQGFELLRESADEALEEVYAEQPELTRELLESLDAASGAGQRRPDLAQSLLDIYDSLRTAGSRIEALPLKTGEDACPTLQKQEVANLWDRRPRLSGGSEGLRQILQDISSLVARLPSSSPAQRMRIERLRTWLVSARPLPANPLDAIRLLEAFECDAKGLRSPFSDELKEIRDVRIPGLLAEYAALHYAPRRNVLTSALERLDRIYRARKRKSSGLDFSDLEEQAIALLERSPEIGERTRQRFEHILMDELQDTNPLQWRLVDLVRTPGCFFGVGDINQSIFGFRHATPDVFRSYRDSLATQALTIDSLRQNYRSVPEILDAVNQVFANAPGVEPHTLTAEQTSNGGAPVEVRIATADTSDDAMDLEARWVARRILDLHGEFRLGEMAILLRTLNSLGPLRRALDDAGIPFVTTGAKSFFESREVRDLILWLRVLDNPLDEISLAGVLRSPLAGVRDETIFRLKRRGGLFEAILRTRGDDLPADEFERIDAFRSRLRTALAERDYIAPDRLLIRVMDDTGYETEAGQAARDSIARLLELVRLSHRNRPGALLDEIDSYQEGAAEIEVASSDSVNAVSIMSIHRAKGLEFPVVFLPFLHRLPGFSKPAICFSASEGLAVRWKSPISERSIAEPAHNRICDALRDREQREEDRLLYVALTRAESRLLLSYSEVKQAPRGWAALIAGALPPGQRVTAPIDVSEPRASASGISTLETVSPPPLTDQHDSVFTVTSLSEYLSCPRRYLLGRYAGWTTARSTAIDEDFETEQVEASEFGRQVHQALAGSAPPDIDPAAVRLARAFQTSELGRRAARASRIEREFEFITSFDQLVVRGQIDLWFEEGGELILVDYKTDNFDPLTEPERIESYALQLRIYSLALERITGRLPHRAVLAFLRSERSIDVDLSRALLDEARSVAGRLAAAQEAMDFPLKEGLQCRRCEFFRSSCPAAGPVTSLDRPPFSVVAPT